MPLGCQAKLRLSNFLVAGGYICMGCRFPGLHNMTLASPHHCMVSPMPSHCVGCLMPPPHCCMVTPVPFHHMDFLTPTPCCTFSLSSPTTRHLELLLIHRLSWLTGPPGSWSHRLPRCTILPPGAKAKNASQRRKWGEPGGSGDSSSWSNVGATPRGKSRTCSSTPCRLHVACGPPVGQPWTKPNTPYRNLLHKNKRAERVTKTLSLRPDYSYHWKR